MDLKLLVAFDKRDIDLRTPSSFSHGDSMQISTAKNIYCKYLPRPALSFLLSLSRNKRSQLVLSLCDTLFSIPNSPSTPYPHISHKMAVKKPTTTSISAGAEVFEIPELQIHVSLVRAWFLQGFYHG